MFYGHRNRKHYPNEVKVDFQGIPLVVQFDYQPYTNGSITEPPSDEELTITDVFHEKQSIIDLVQAYPSLEDDLRIQCLEDIHND